MIHSIALAWTLALAVHSPVEVAPDVPPEVRVRLLADVTHVTPGAEFRIAVHLTIPAGWHVYGENPGDTGLATKAALVAPEGFEVGAAEYPAPTAHLAAGVTSYVYESEVALFFPVRAPEELAAGSPLAFEASASWLACRRTCLPGRGVGRLALKVGSEPPRPAHAAELRPHRARLPRPWDELKGASLRWREGNVVSIAVTGAAALEFLPAVPADWGAARIESRRVDDAPVVDVAVERLREETELAPTLAGVLRVVDGEGRERFFRVEATRDA